MVEAGLQHGVCHASSVRDHGLKYGVRLLSGPLGGTVKHDRSGEKDPYNVAGSAP
jgi:hypothetical protein